jgi:hypothetical protein
MYKRTCSDLRLGCIAHAGASNQRKWGLLGLEPPEPELKTELELEPRTEATDMMGVTEVTEPKVGPEEGFT